MSTIFGVKKELVERTHLSITRMEELFQMEGAAGPQDDIPGDMMGPPPEPPPSYASLHIENGEISEKSRKQYVFGGNCDGKSGNDMRLVIYESDVGGVFAEGTATNFVLEDSAISISGNGQGLGGASSGAAAGNGGTLTLRNVVITTNGASRCATAADNYGLLRVYDSVLISQGGPFGEDAPTDRALKGGPPAPLEISGNCRTHCTTGNSQSYFYNSTIIGDGWAALSTDMSDGYVYLEATDCVVKMLKSGYGAYADTFCHDVFNRCEFDVASMAGIIAGESDMAFNDCTVNCGTYFAFLHCVGGPPTQVTTLKVSGGDVNCVSEAITVRSTNAVIDLTDTKISSESGVLIRSIVNPDPHSTKVRGKKVFGIRVNITDMDAEGDILHEDNDREMYLNLNSARVRGAIKGACLSMDLGSKWYATADSEVELISNVESGQFDAPEGVTIRAKGKASQEFDLYSGGKLIVTC